MRPSVRQAARYSRSPSSVSSPSSSSKSAFASSPRLTGRSVHASRYPATCAASGEKVCSWTLMPMPMTTAGPLCVGTSSVRMPLTLRPAQTRSFGHLMPQSSPAARRTARAPATAASAGTVISRSSGSVGRSRYDRYSPTPAGEENERPSRPRPAVCRSAITAAPDGAPASASSLTRLFVESVCASTCRWERPASGANSSRNFMENALLFKRKSF